MTAKANGKPWDYTPHAHAMRQLDSLVDCVASKPDQMLLVSPRIFIAAKMYLDAEGKFRGVLIVNSAW